MARSVARSIARSVVVALGMAALVMPLSTMPVRGAPVAQSAAGTTEFADTVAPTQPTSFGVLSRTKSRAITLGWVASDDDVGVAGYRLYRNGTWVGTLYQAGVDLMGSVLYDRLDGRM